MAKKLSTKLERLQTSQPHKLWDLIQGLIDHAKELEKRNDQLESDIDALIQHRG